MEDTQHKPHETLIRQTAVKGERASKRIAYESTWGATRYMAHAIRQTQCLLRRRWFSKAVIQKRQQQHLLLDGWETFRIHSE